MIAPRRFAMALCLIPFATPALVLLQLPFTSSSWSVWREAPRILEQFAFTVALISLSVGFAIPVGALLAVLAFRLRIRGATCLRGLLLALLFVPLPALAAGWVACFRVVGLRPSDSGLLIAAWIHALAALPWVVWIVGVALRRVDRDREEAALLELPARQVLLQVTLRECRPIIALAAFGIAVHCLSEIAVTDLTGTPTLAEEAYLQFSGDRLGLERTVALFIPLVVLLMVAAGRLIASQPPTLLMEADQPALLFIPTPRNGVLCTTLFALIAAIFCLPLVALLNTAANGSLHDFANGMLLVVRAHGRTIVESLFWSSLAAALAASAALYLGWSVLDLRRGTRLLFLLAVALWVIPGPVVGFGLNSLIQDLLDLEEFVLGRGDGTHPLNTLLYNSPSPIPVLWVQTIRLFPFAFALQWLMLRRIPREEIESARIDGGHGWPLFRWIIWPRMRRTFFVAVLAGMALAMGELSATKIAQVPGRRTFIEEMFSQMHYGADATVARLVLVQLAIAGALMLTVIAVGRVQGKGSSTARPS